MKVFDIIIYASIAIMYNLFVHNLASITYQDLQYEDKHNNTIIMLVIFGIMGIVISKIIGDKKKYDNKYVKNGLYYGGILLILAALITNWTEIGSELKLVGMALGLGLLIWYGYKIENK